MDDDALIEAAAADAAAGVTAVDLGGWLGLMLYMYGEDLSAVAWGMPDLDPPLGIGNDTMDELAMLDGHGEAITALRARVAGGDGWELVERFYLALARHAHELIGRPVLVYESMLMPEEEQLARQGGREGSFEHPLAGLDVIVHVRVDEYRVAAIWRSEEEGVVVASGSVGHAEEVEPVWRCSQLGADPVVLAGELPPGAVAPVLPEGVPIVSGGYWICLTRRRSLPSDPEIRFLDAEGEVFDEVIASEGGVPCLWPTQGPPGAQVVQRGGGTEVLEADEWRVEITDWGPFAPAAGEVAHELGIKEARIPARPLAGSVLGHRHGFELAAQDGCVGGGRHMRRVRRDRRGARRTACPARPRALRGISRAQLNSSPAPPIRCGDDQGGGDHNLVGLAMLVARSTEVIVNTADFERRRWYTGPRSPQW